MHPENTKPAATEHGTGSGETQDELCPRCHDKKILHKSGGCMAMDCSCSLTFIPASPTVTLQRWSFVTDDRTGSPVAFPNPDGQWVKYDDALALLRAAERHQP